MCITVIDEGDSRKYYVHKHILQKRSPYFAASTRFREGEENHVIFDNMNHHAFRQVLHWMYTGNFQAGPLYNMRNFMRTWVVADRLMMSQCKNMAMDELRLISEENVQSVRVLCELEELGHGPDSTITRYLLDQIAWDAVFDEEWADTPAKIFATHWTNSEIHAQLLWRVLTIAREFEQAKRGLIPMPTDPAFLEGCRYHDHVKGEEPCHLENKEEAGHEAWIT